MSRLFLPAAGLILLVVSGAVHGIQAGRWRDPDLLTRAAARLDATPREVGSWSSEAMELSERQLKVAEAAGGTAVRYEMFDPKTGPQSVEVILLCGPFGPVAVHPPTVCFRGVGYRQLTEEKRIAVEDDAGRPLGTFWATEFERRVDGVPQRIRTWWGWSEGGRWSAPSNPRLAYAGTPVLYKIYFTENVRSDGSPSAIRSFAQQFLPGIQETVFAEES